MATIKEKLDILTTETGGIGGKNININDYFPSSTTRIVNDGCWGKSNSEETPNKSNKILDFFYKEETPTHVEVDEEGNETIVEDEPVKNLDWFKIGATSTGLAALIGLLIWLIKRRH